MKIVFMGTPDFSVGPLEALVENGYEITAVVTQPDKPKGRSGQLVPSPVKECALKYNLPVFQPAKIKSPEAVETLKSFEADIFIVVAFGQIMSQEILDMPPMGCFNIHASLLPKYRGAAPIQWSIINGDQETGVTIMKMDIGIDTGDIYTQKVVPISDEDTGESLFDKLKDAGSELLIETLPLLEKGELQPQKQDESSATHVKMLSKEFGCIDFSKSADEIEHLVRGLNSWPSAFTYYQGKMMKIWKSKVSTKEVSDVQPGTIACVNKSSIEIATGKDLLEVFEIQLEGKKRMSVEDFLKGHKFEVGTQLGKA